VIAALFVETDGVYYGLPDVDPWDKIRDARLYAGPHPVVAHPPCERWGRYALGGPNPNARRRKIGDDDGCFLAALAAVRRWGGVLEHPEASHAWRVFGLGTPPRSGGWVTADWQGGWTCCVEQGHYGHRARKATWLYACRAGGLPSLTWGPSDKAHPLARLDAGFHNKEERQRAQKRGMITRLSQRQAARTPVAFRDLLLDIARSAIVRVSLPEATP
jgi:hypothetical protein